MKSYACIILLIAVSSISSKRVYKCASELKLDTCYLKEEKIVGDETTNTYYVDACSKGKVCNVIDEESSMTSQCTKVKYLLLEGEKCESPYECLSKTCTSNKCEAVSDGGKCSGNQCKLGSYCSGSGDTAVCKKYAAKDGACGGDNPECRPGLTCVENKCVALFSLENGSKTDDKDACKSGHSYYTGTEYQCGIVKSVGTCSDPTAIAEVTITFASDTTKTCNCNVDCSYLQSDKDTQPAYDEYVKAFSDEIDDILDDDDYLEYYMLTGDDDTFGIKKLKEKWVEVEHYSEIADAASEDDKDCVRDYYIRQMSSNKLYFSLFGLILFALALL